MRCGHLVLLIGQQLSWTSRCCVLTAVVLLSNPGWKGTQSRIASSCSELGAEEWHLQHRLCQGMLDCLAQCLVAQHGDFHVQNPSR